MKSKKILVVFFILFLLSLHTNMACAESYLTINDYTIPVIFNNMKIVLIQKGDRMQYKDIDYDDSGWTPTSLPSDWDDLYKDYNGICWYRIHIHFPDTLPEKSLGILLGTITDADEVYFNGQLIGKSGQIEPVQKSAYDKIRMYEIPTIYINPGAKNILAIRVKGLFSYQNGPFFGDFRIDAFKALQDSFFIRELFDMYFIISYVIVGVYFLLFFLRRIRDRENLLFSLFSLGMAVYFFLRTQLKYLLGVEFFILKKIEYCVLCWLILLIIEFLVFYFKKKHTIFNYIFGGCTLISFITILVTGDYVFWDKFNQFFMLPSWGLGVILGMWIVISKLKTDIDARLMIVPFLLLLTTFANDIMVNMGIYSFIRLTNYGFFFLIGLIAIILSNRFVRLHYEVEDLNVNLENKVEVRTEELNRTVKALEAAKEETDNILRNVKEGIFLMDNDYNIGKNYSMILEQIFETEDLSEQNFISLIKPKVNKKTLDSVQDFLSILFTRNLSEKRLKSLNPLEDIEVSIQKNGKMIKKYLNFAFTRIKDRENIPYILATVRDFTERKILAKEIETSKQKAQNEMQLLFSIVHLNPIMLKRFINEVHDELNNMEELLEKARFSGELKQLLNHVYRSVHSIKGNAGILGLDIFTRQAHEFEEKIKSLYEAEKLPPVDLIGLLYPILDLKKQVEQVENVLSMIASFEKSYGKSDMSNQAVLLRTLSSLSLRVAEREHKKVMLNTDSFTIGTEEGVSLFSIGDSFASLKKILIQLVKNAITHGIELPEERIAKGKGETGLIEIKSFVSDDSFVITIRDDGMGIRIKSIRESLLESGKYSHEELERMPAQSVVQHIFEPGVTTQKRTSIDAGRGVGLDLVKHEIEKNNGKIKISFKSDEYTMFTLAFPLKKLQE